MPTNFFFFLAFCDLLFSSPCFQFIAMPNNVYESAARILASLSPEQEASSSTKKGPRQRNGADSNDGPEFPSVTSTQLKSLIYTNSRSTTTNTITSQSNSSKKQSADSSKASSSNNNHDLRQLYAIVASTLKYAPVLRPIVRASDLMSPKFADYRYFVNEWHAMAMVYDLLLSKSGRVIAPKCKAKDSILKHKTRLHGEFVKWKVRNRVRDVKTDLERFTNPLVEDAGDREKEQGGNGDDENFDETPVRWVRLNAIKCTSKEELDSREEELTNNGQVKFVENWHDVRKPSAEGNQLVIYKDKNVENLYGVNPTRFPVITSSLYTSGRLIIQDRASCFPATILVHNLRELGVTLKPQHELAPSSKPKSKSGAAADYKGSIQLIDACSAPGNKTTHLTGLALKYYQDLLAPQSAGKSAITAKPKQHQSYKFIAAFERSEFRAKTLSKMLSVAGASKYVSVNVQDFTRSNPRDFANVLGLVVDPSCSGSGIFGRKNAAPLPKTDTEKQKEGDDDHEEEEEEEDEDAQGMSKEEEDRLLKLAGFQYKVVKHALSFPKAQVVVYSTCSIHAHENEHVVDRLMNDNEVAKVWGWRVQTRSAVVPGWDRRGIAAEFKLHEQKHGEAGLQQREQMAQGCVRAVPKKDGGIGFFAVCFVRDMPGQTQGQEDEEWTGLSE